MKVLPFLFLRTPSCNRVSACSLLNTIFHIEINENAGGIFLF